MTDHKFDKFSQYFDSWQKNVITLTLKRDLANKELENYIKSFRYIDSEIYKSLFAAKEFYGKKQRYYKQKINKLKQQEIEFGKILKYEYQEKKKVIEKKKKDEISTSIKHVKNTIEELEDKIYNLNNRIEEQALDIDEENYIIEEIQKLDRNKQLNLRHLKKLEEELSIEIRNNPYFKTLRSIEILEVNLKGIHKNLKKWSKWKVKIHKQMLELYQKAKEFEKIKMQIEKELLRARQTTDNNLQLFYDSKKESEKNAFQEHLKIFKDKAKAKERNKLKTTYIIKKKRLRKSYSKAKLAAALKKQKAGKRLDFYELKLILEHSKEKKLKNIE